MLEKYFDLTCSDPRWGNSYYAIHGSTMEKLASDCYTPDSLVATMRDLSPREDGRYILLNAMGAGEAWGPNRNADYFPEWSLKGDQAPEGVVNCLKKHAAHIEGNTLREPCDYGHETFVKHAHVYRGHQNKDPEKACGEVIASAYNEKMRRVELITFIKEAVAPDIVQRIDNGEPVAFSMGSKLPSDVCSICNNVARTRAEYCEHLQTKLGHILEDGRQVFSYNYFPKFFDISEVQRPADQSAWMLQKVASVVSNLPTPPAFEAEKVSEIHKEIPAEVTQDPKNEVPDELVRFIKNKIKDDMVRRSRIKTAELAHFAPDVVFHTCTALGVILTPDEVVKLSSEDLRTIPTEFDPALVDRRIAKRLEGFLKKASYFDPLFTKRVVRPEEELTGHLAPAASAAFDKYASYLRSLDFDGFTTWVENSSTTQLAVNPDGYLSKIAGDTGQSSQIWLPFIIGISMLHTTY